MYRQCSRCGEEKPVDEFRRAHRGERHYQCRACMAEWKRERSPDVKRRDRELYRVRHPEKHRAHRAVRKAVARGTLVRPDACVRCGAVGPVHAHHEDYERRFDVEWLCLRCHADQHAQAA